MSRRSRRATEPVSSSASMTTRPPTMCSPPENLSRAVTSALRSEVFVHSTRESSSLTIAVIAICEFPSPSYRSCCRPEAPSFRYPAVLPYSLARPDHGGQGGGQARRVVPWCAVGLGHRGQHELGAAVTHCSKQTMPVNNRFLIRDHR